MTATMSNIKPGPIQGHPFYCHTWTVGGATFHIGFARGFNAYGLIGTECNGIFILDVDGKGILLREYKGTQQCWRDDERLILQAKKEIDRIMALDEAGLSEFLSSTPGVRYNPFADRKAVDILKKADLNLAKKVKKDRFNQTVAKGQMTPARKKTILREFEKFIVSRLYGPESVAEAAFTLGVYQVLHLYCGYIAHYDRTGFYDAQLRSDEAFAGNLKKWAEGRGDYSGYTILRADSRVNDLLVQMVEIAKAYQHAAPSRYRVAS